MERFSSGYQKAASRKKFSKMQKVLYIITQMCYYIYIRNRKSAKTRKVKGKCYERIKI